MREVERVDGAIRGDRAKVVRYISGARPCLTERPGKRGEYGRASERLSPPRTMRAPDFGWDLSLDPASKLESSAPLVAWEGEILSIQRVEQLAKGAAFEGSRGRREIDRDGS